MTVTVTIGEKGRLVLPIAVREQVGLAPGDELIVRPIGEGQVMLETRAAVVRRLRSRFAGGGGSAGLAEARAMDRLIEARQDESRGADTPRNREAERRRGDQILEALGVTPPQSLAG